MKHDLEAGEYIVYVKGLWEYEETSKFGINIAGP